MSTTFGTPASSPALNSGSLSFRRSTRPKRSSDNPEANNASSPAATPRGGSQSIGPDTSNSGQTDKPRAPWWHPEELQYICHNDLPQNILIEYLCHKAFSIPPRETNSSISLFRVVTRDGTIIALPRGYRVPLLFVAKFQWDSLKLVLTASDPQKEWAEYKFDIVHLSRLCQRLFIQAAEAQKDALTKGAKGLDRGWRSATFDRVLTRFFHRWFISREWSIRKFWEEFDEDEYDNDVLKHDWVRWSIKGHKGFSLTKDEVQQGVTAQQFMQGFGKNEQGVWVWVESPASLAYSASASLTASTMKNPIVVEDESNSDETITLAKLEELFDVRMVRMVTTTPSHNTIEVKKERLELPGESLSTMERTQASSDLCVSAFAQATAENIQPGFSQPLLSGASAPSNTPPVGPDRPLPKAATSQSGPPKRRWVIQCRKTGGGPRRVYQDAWGIPFRSSSSEDEPEGSSSSSDDDRAKDGDYRAPRKRVKVNHSGSTNQIKSSKPSSTRAVVRKTSKRSRAAKATNGRPEQPTSKTECQPTSPGFRILANYAETKTPSLILPKLSITTKSPRPTTRTSITPTPVPGTLTPATPPLSHDTTVPNTNGPATNNDAGATTSRVSDPPSDPSTPPALLHVSAPPSSVQVGDTPAKQSGSDLPCIQQPPSVQKLTPNSLDSMPLVEDKLTTAQQLESTSPAKKNESTPESQGKNKSTARLLLEIAMSMGLYNPKHSTILENCSGSSDPTSSLPASSLNPDILPEEVSQAAADLSTLNTSSSFAISTPSTADEPPPINPFDVTPFQQADGHASTMSDGVIDMSTTSLPQASPLAEQTGSAEPDSLSSTSKQCERMDIDEPVPLSNPVEDLQETLTSLLTNPSRVKVLSMILLLRNLLWDHGIHHRMAHDTLCKDSNSSSVRVSLYQEAKTRYVIPEETESLTMEERLDLVGKCSSFLSKYIAVYSGEALDQKVVELDDRLRQELTNHGVMEITTTERSVQHQAPPCIRIDKEVSTVSLDTAGSSVAPDNVLGSEVQTEADHDEMVQDPVTVQVTRQSLTPDATMVDLSSTLADALNTEAAFSGDVNPATRIMSSMMRNMADLLDCTSGGDGGDGGDVKGKGRATDGAELVVPYNLPIVNVLLHELKSMKEEMRKSHQRNREEIASISRFHRTEVDSLKGQLQTTEDRCRHEIGSLRQRHRQEMDSLLGILREAEKDRDKEPVPRLPVIELLELRRRIASLEGHVRSGGPSNLPFSEDESDVTVIRRVAYHPLGHLLDPEDGCVPSSPLPQRTSPDGVASASKPGTPIQADRESMIIDSIPLPIKSQRKFQSIQRLSLA